MRQEQKESKSEGRIEREMREGVRVRQEQKGNEGKE